MGQRFPASPDHVDPRGQACHLEITVFDHDRYPGPGEGNVVDTEPAHRRGQGRIDPEQPTWNPRVTPKQHPKQVNRRGRGPGLRRARRGIRDRPGKLRPVEPAEQLGQPAAVGGSGVEQADATRWASSTNP